jgi:hypothetical protein
LALRNYSEMAGFRECGFAEGAIHRALERPLGRSLSALAYSLNRKWGLTSRDLAPSQKALKPTRSVLRLQARHLTAAAIKHHARLAVVLSCCLKQPPPPGHRR